MRKFIGIDLGGTNVRVALIDEDGNILEDVIRPSLANEGPQIVLDNVVEMLKTIDYKSAESIGIGIPGPIDTKGGFASLSSNLKDFAGFKVRDYLENIFDMPVYLDNDCNVAGLAEAVLGSGKGYSIVYYITHSTGIGGALVIDGKTVSGRKGYAGEIGNIVIDRDRPKVNHLNAGSAESEASGSALVNKAKQLLDPSIESAYDIFNLAKEGDPVATEIIDTMIYDFATLMATVAHVVDPDVFILGGGVSKSHKDYLDRVMEVYKTLVHPQMEDIEVKIATLEEPGVVGAAMLGRKRD